MTIPAEYQITPFPSLARGQPIVDPRTGVPTDYFLGLMQQWRERALGAARIIPCAASGTNLITLTPNYPVAPLIEGYRDYDVFAFVAANNSTGAVTATVVPAKGTLATLKVYIDGGATQAGSGDVDAGKLYLAIFNDALDAGAGGLVLK